MICLAHQVFCFHFQVELHFHDHILRRGLFENSILILDFISKSGWWANMVYWISVKSDLNKLDNYGPQNLFLLSGLELPQTWTERKKANKKKDAAWFDYCQIYAQSKFKYSIFVYRTPSFYKKKLLNHFPQVKVMNLLRIQSLLTDYLHTSSKRSARSFHVKYTISFLVRC